MADGTLPQSAPFLFALSVTISLNCDLFCLQTDLRITGPFPVKPTPLPGAQQKARPVGPKQT